MSRLWLDILPGVAAVAGGLGLIAASRRVSAVAGGWVALAAGVWFLIGPSLAMLWGRSIPGTIASGIGAPLGGHDRAAIEAIGFFYGVGAVITCFAAFAVGRFASRPALVADGEAAGPTPPAASEPPREPGDRREPILRRGRARRTRQPTASN